MAYLVTKDAVDSPSLTLCCIYNAQKLEGEVIESKTVYFEQSGKQNPEKIEFYQNGTKCSDVPCSRTPIPDPPCIAPLTQPLKRIVVTKNNKNVYIEGKLFAVQGDLAQGLSTERPIVGPFKYLTIHIANQPVA